MSKDDPISPQALDALRARFEAQSRRAQTYYSVMHRVRAFAGTDDAASAWMDTPLPAFDGRTPAQLIGEGREDELLAYIGSLPSPPTR